VLYERYVRGQTDTRTDAFITILRHRSCGRISKFTFNGIRLIFVIVIIKYANKLNFSNWYGMFNIYYMYRCRVSAASAGSLDFLIPNGPESNVSHRMYYIDVSNFLIASSMTGQVM